MRETKGLARHHREMTGAGRRAQMRSASVPRLTPTQRSVVHYAAGAGRELVRYKHGLWSGPNEARPLLNASTNTVNALIGKGVVDVVERDDKGRATKVRLRQRGSSERRFQCRTWRS